MPNKYDRVFGLAHGRLSMGKKPILLMALVGVSALAVVGCERGKVYICRIPFEEDEEVCATSKEEAIVMCGNLFGFPAETNRSCWRRPRREGTVYKCQLAWTGTTIYLCAKSLPTEQLPITCYSVSPSLSFESE
jgi:hypothetical protein